MKILALETATEACSAALFIDGEINERFEIAPRGHGDLILQMMDELLAEAGLKPQQLDVLGFGRGPGAFTGVRIATSVIQGVAFGLDLPVAPVSTLAALAQGVARQTNHKSLLCAIDARMNEVYWGAYTVAEDGLVMMTEEECVCPAANAPVLEGEWFGIGSGWQAYEAELSNRYQNIITGVDANVLPRAYDICLLTERAFLQGEVVAAEEALPVYLRDKVVG